MVQKTSLRRRDTCSIDLGVAGHIELEFPTQRQETQKRFRYAQYSRYQVNRVAVSFQRGGYTYALFDSYEGDTPPKTHQQGVQVRPSGGARKEVTFICRGAAQRQSIQPQLYPSMR